MRITNIKVRLSYHNNQATDAVGYSDVTFDDSLIVRGFVIRNTKSGIRIADPSLKQKERCIKIASMFGTFREHVYREIIKTYKVAALLRSKGELENGVYEFAPRTSSRSQRWDT